VIYGAACSYCLARAERLEGSCLRTFALELKERLARILAAFVTSILTQPLRRLDTDSAAEPPPRQIIKVLRQVLCRHDAEKLAIFVPDIYEGGYHEERSLTWCDSHSGQSPILCAAPRQSKLTRFFVGVDDVPQLPSFAGSSLLDSQSTVLAADNFAGFLPPQYVV